MEINQNGTKLFTLKVNFEFRTKKSILCNVILCCNPSYTLYNEWYGGADCRQLCQILFDIFNNTQYCVYLYHGYM